MITDIPILTMEEINARLMERKKNWKPGNSRDGFMLLGRKTYTYQNIEYDVVIMAYVCDNQIAPMGKRIPYHACLEHPAQTKEFVKLVEGVEQQYGEFLWYDTLHSHNDSMTIEEQIEECHQQARQDIDGVPQYIEKAYAKIEEIKANIKKLEQFMEKMK